MGKQEAGLAPGPQELETLDGITRKESQGHRVTGESNCSASSNLSSGIEGMTRDGGAIPQPRVGVSDLDHWLLQQHKPSGVGAQEDSSILAIHH